MIVKLNETQLRQFLNIVTDAEIFFYALCMTALFYPFMAKKTEQRINKIKKTAIVFCVYIGMYSVNMILSVYGWLCMAIVLALLMAASHVLEMDKTQILLLGVVFYCIRVLSTLAATSVNFFSSKWFLQAVETEETAERILYHVALNYCLIEAFQIVLSGILLYPVGHRWRKKAKPLHIRELFYLLLTPIIGILFGTIIFRLLVVVKEHTVFELYEQFPTFTVIVPLIAAMFYVGILITIESYQRMTDLQQERETYFVEQQQVHAIQERMEEVEQFYTGIRQMRHEMKNHLTNIKGLMKSGSYEDMEQYIDKMDDNMNVFTLTVQTGNAVTDVIVNDKKNAADKQGIKFESEFTYPVSDGYNAYDIGIIINNLLQNALEASGKIQEEKRYIFLLGKQKKKFFLIQVKNFFEGEIAFDKNKNLPISTKKEDSSLHGIGLSNVKREAEKYEGDVDIKVKKNEFSVTVLLQERRSTCINGSLSGN